MKTAGELAKEYRAQPSSEYEWQTPLHSRVMARMWLRMTEIYGHKWTSAQGEEPTETWSRALSALSADEIKAGLKTCLTSGDAWPPSLPQFLALCKTPKRENEAMYHYAGPALPHKISDEQRDKGRAALAEMRGRLTA